MSVPLRVVLCVPLLSWPNGLDAPYLSSYSHSLYHLYRLFFSKRLAGKAGKAAVPTKQLVSIKLVVWPMFLAKKACIIQGKTKTRIILHANIPWTGNTLVIPAGRDTRYSARRFSCL